MKLAKLLGYWFSAILARAGGWFRRSRKFTHQIPSTSTKSAPSPIASLSAATSAVARSFRVERVGDREYWRDARGTLWRVLARDASTLVVGRRRPRTVHAV